MMQTYLFSRTAMMVSPGAKIEFMVVAKSPEAAREVLKHALRRAVLNIGGYPVPLDISALWSGVEPVAIGHAGAHESSGLVGIMADGLTSRDENG